jgi:hypothetical protein
MRVAFAMNLLRKMILARRDNRFWRTGKNERTMASWIIETPAHGAPELRVVIANPGRQEEARGFILEQKLRREMK